MANKNRCSNLHYTHLWLSWTVFAIAGMLLMASCSRPAAPVFEKDFALTISTEGQGSVNQRVINEGDFTAGAPKRVELTANPAEGLEFTGWQGDIQGNQNPVVIEVDRNKEIVAIFTTEAANDSGRDNTTAVVEVTSPTGRIWMDRNLGASRAATSSTDSQAFGDLYQWGRAADGHQMRNSSATSTLSNSDQPNHGNFIWVSTDWRSPQNNNLWQGVNGINNPCPIGYRLPTEAEWEAERQSWSSSNASGAFNSPLKLPVAGYRNRLNGSLFNVGSNGSYWSGTVDGTYSRHLFFNSSSADMYSYARAYGYSVRCLKN